MVTRLFTFRLTCRRLLSGREILVDRLVRELTSWELVRMVVTRREELLTHRDCTEGRYLVLVRLLLVTA